jgi:hypothetical protein
MQHIITTAGEYLIQLRVANDLGLTDMLDTRW